MGKDEDEFRVVPGYEDYEVNRYGILREVKTQKMCPIKRNKNVNGILYRVGEKVVRPHIFMYLAFNPYRVEDIGVYKAITHKHIYYVDDDIKNIEMKNIRIKEGSKHLLETGNKNILETHKGTVETYWDFYRNNCKGIYPENYTKMSTKVVWWRCEEGHKTQGRICNVLRSKTKCGVCRNNGYKKVKRGKEEVKYKKTIDITHEHDLRNYWDYERNNELGITPEKYTKGSDKKVWWKCEKGHKYLRKVGEQLAYSRCMECNKKMRMSIPQQVITIILEGNFNNVISEKRVGKYSVDVYVPELKLAIEYDGCAWHNNKNKIMSDEKKETLIFEKLGVERIIRVREKGAYPIESRGDIVEYDYNKDSIEGYRELKNIAYRIVRGYKSEVNDISDEEFREMRNTLWRNPKNSILKTHPELEEYYSGLNRVKFKDITYGERTVVTWDCPKCGNVWDKRVSSVTSIKGERCPKCREIYNIKKKALSKKNKKDRESKRPKRPKNPQLRRIKQKKNKRSNCLFCGEEYQKESDRSKYCKTECYIKDSEKLKVGKEELIRSLKLTPNFTELGKMYGVSDNAVRKKCKKYGITTDLSYWLRDFRERNSMTYRVSKMLENIEKEDYERVDYVIRNYKLKGKKKIVGEEKIVSKNIYEAIEKKYKLENR